MSPFVIATLLVLALLLPVIGAVVLRFIGSRLSNRQSYGVAAFLLVVPVASVIGLSRAQIPSLQLAGITIVLTQPTIGVLIPQSVLDALPTESAPMGGEMLSTPTVQATNELATAESGTAEPSLTEPGTAEPRTAEPSPTLEPPSATPEPPSATPEPPSATPEPPSATSPAAPATRSYTVQPGDTLRSIASQFNVSVDALLQANNLTRQQGDALRVGQKLVIP